MKQHVLYNCPYITYPMTHTYEFLWVAETLTANILSWRLSWVISMKCYCLSLDLLTFYITWFVRGLSHQVVCVVNTRHSDILSEKGKSTLISGGNEYRTHGDENTIESARSHLENGLAHSNPYSTTTFCNLSKPGESYSTRSSGKGKEAWNNPCLLTSQSVP